MGIFDKLKGGKKDKVFEDELMDTQSELIALTLNMVGKAADKIFDDISWGIIKWNMAMIHFQPYCQVIFLNCYLN